MPEPQNAAQIVKSNYSWSKYQFLWTRLQKAVASAGHPAALCCAVGWCVLWLHIGLNWPLQNDMEELWAVSITHLHCIMCWMWAVHVTHKLNAGALPAVTCCPLAVDMKNCVQVSEMYNLVKKTVDVNVNVFCIFMCRISNSSCWRRVCC